MTSILKDIGSVDVFIAQVDIALFIRRELSKQVATFVWQKPENGTVTLDLFVADRIVSIPFSLLELQKSDHLENRKCIRERIRKSVEKGGSHGQTQRTEC